MEFYNMADLIKAASIGMASEFAFYLKAHNFHWNVTGPDFSEYHALFGEIYAEVFGAIDLYAENIRKMDAYAPASFSTYSALSTIGEMNEVPDSMTMVAILADDASKLAELSKMVYRMAEEVGEFGFANFLADRQDAYRKHAWMLRSSLQ
jgi:starvation-inducible DNA-binding protein